MIETLEQDHIYYAKVRGLSKKSIIFWKEVIKMLKDSDEIYAGEKIFTK